MGDCVREQLDTVILKEFRNCKDLIEIAKVFVVKCTVYYVWSVSYIY